MKCERCCQWSNKRIYIAQINVSLKIVPVWNLWGLSCCLCQNNNIRVLEEVVQLHFLRSTWQANNYFRISFLSHGIALAKHMLKQGEVIFFQFGKKIEWPCCIENLWENTRIRSSWIKVGCGKGLYYQTTLVILWNLLRITTDNAVVRYFSSFCRTD